MSPKKRVAPTVAIIGRPNVGKSTLFNRITGKARSIVHGEAGVTRDRSYGTTSWGGVELQLVDTGGIVEHPIDPIEKKIQAQVRLALEQAVVVILLCDVRDGLCPADEVIADELRRLGKKTLVAANKADNPDLGMASSEFYELGFGDVYAISALHGSGVADLLDGVVADLPQKVAAARPDDEQVLRIAIVGRPNVGKSTLINALVDEERVIVDDKPGTTRDAVDISLTRYGKQYVLVDTAGVRRKSSVKRQVERFSVNRTLRTIRNADITILMFDGAEGVVEQDCKIAGLVKDAGKGLILTANKWDIVEGREKRFKQLTEECKRKFSFARFAPLLTISALERKRIFKLFDLVDRVAEECSKRIPTHTLNKHFETAKLLNPPSRKGRAAKIYYVAQTDINPPTFMLFANNERLIHFSYLRYLENSLRESFGFQGTPLKLVVQGKG
jgi:GTP-binding protein